MSHKYPCIYYDNGKCQKFSDDTYTAWCDFDQCEHITQSNGDRIRGMSDDEMAVFLECFGVCHYCSEHERLENEPLLKGERCDEQCEQHVLYWLKQPYKEYT